MYRININYNDEEKIYPNFSYIILKKMCPNLFSFDIMILLNYL